MFILRPLSCKYGPFQGVSSPQQCHFLLGNTAKRLGAEETAERHFRQGSDLGSFLCSFNLGLMLRSRAQSEHPPLWAAAVDAFQVALTQVQHETEPPMSIMGYMVRPSLVVLLRSQSLLWQLSSPFSGCVDRRLARGWPQVKRYLGEALRGINKLADAERSLREAARGGDCGAQFHLGDLLLDRAETGGADPRLADEGERLLRSLVEGFAHSGALQDPISSEVEVAEMRIRAGFRLRALRAKRGTPPPTTSVRARSYGACAVPDAWPDRS